MQAASPRAEERGSARADTAPILVASSNADDHCLLAALPIAAGIFCLNGGKLWVQALNQRFFDLAGCDGGP
ncbi:MAG TPA: hypothetical protein VE403_01795, partial [Sphingomicrobium sp.]|nr:hypothetical protein [Sphingomicrobium sp.]